MSKAERCIQGDKSVGQHTMDYRGTLFFCQAEDGIRDAQESRGLGDVYKVQILHCFLIKHNKTILSVFLENLVLFLSLCR